MGDKGESARKIITAPNLISFFRIILIIPFVIAIQKDNYVRAGIILVISGISDLLDGYMARRFGRITDLGKLLDPAADKLTLIAVMICVGMKFPEVIPFMALLVTKELAMMAASAVLIKKKLAPTSAKWYGKIGTVAFYVSVTIIVTLKAVWNIENKALNISLTATTSFLMLYALVKYMKLFIDVIKKNEKKS